MEEEGFLVGHSLSLRCNIFLRRLIKDFILVLSGILPGHFRDYAMLWWGANSQGICLDPPPLVSIGGQEGVLTFIHLHRM